VPEVSAIRARNYSPLQNTAEDAAILDEWSANLTL